MKWWYHVIASILGFALAALIVFLVFGRADQSANPDRASARGAAATARTGCGSIAPSAVTDPAAIAAANGNLPPIVVDGREVVPARADQRRWFARLVAATGLCAVQVEVTDKTLLVSATYPKGTPVATAGQFAYATLTRGFEPPLNRDAMRVNTQIGSQRRMVATTASAWRSFQRARVLHRLPASIEGLRNSQSRVDYARELVVDGW